MRRAAGMGLLNRAINFFAHFEFHRLPENRSGEGERMELAVFAARIHVCRERLDEFRVNVSAQRRYVKISVVHAADDGTESERDEFANQLARIHFPDGEQPAQTDARQIFLAPPSEVFEKNVAEDAAGDAARLECEQALGHFLLILVIGTAAADKHCFQWQTNGPRLLFEQFQAHAVHRNALKMFVARREQRDHFITAGLHQLDRKSTRLNSSHSQISYAV